MSAELKPKKRSLLFVVFFWVLGISVFGNVVALIISPPVSEEQKAANKIQEEKQKALQKAKDEEQNIRYAFVSGFAFSIRDSLRNPDSLIWETVRASSDGSVICAEYRAQNGFGGMNREHAVKVKMKILRTPSAWNANCLIPLPDAMWEIKHAESRR